MEHEFKGWPCGHCFSLTYNRCWHKQSNICACQYFRPHTYNLHKMIKNILIKKLTIKNVFKELGWGSRDFRKSECNNEF